MTDEVYDYIKRWYDEIYDSKTQELLPQYFDPLQNEHQLIINPDDTMIDIITEFSESKNNHRRRYDNFAESKLYKSYRQDLYDHIIDEKTNFHIYADDINHCSDMMYMYNTFIYNYDSGAFIELMDIEKSMALFVVNIHYPIFH